MRQSIYTTAVLICMALAGTVGATSVFQVTIDTSPLAALQGLGPYFLDLQLIKGQDVGTTNTAVLTGFQFGGGAAVPPPTLVNDASGSLAGTVTLTAGTFVLNEFTQQFSPGSQLSFLLTLTTSFDAAFFPDEFSLAILDGTLAEIPTTSAANAFLIVDIDGAGLTPQTFSSIGAWSDPPVTIQAEAVPEPDSVAMVLLGCVALAAIALWKLQRGR